MARASWTSGAWFLGRALLPVALAISAAGAFSSEPAGRILATAQERLDAGRPEAALEILRRLVEDDRDHSEALLLRSTAYFMLGQVEEGRRDLERSLELDPEQRQAWLNRAALDLAEERHDDALAALTRARDLDPTAPENELNIGAVLLLKGNLSEANRSFGRYLDRHLESAEAHYLVATNYAMAGYAALAIQSLKRAIDLDERWRLRARTDPNFSQLEEHPQYQELLAEIRFAPAPGGFVTERMFAVAYDGAQGRFLGAVIDALHFSGEIFESRVEVTPDWAVIWGEIRIEVRRAGAKQTVVQLSAAAGGLSPADWRRRAGQLLEEIGSRLEEATQRPD